MSTEIGEIPTTSILSLRGTVGIAGLCLLTSARATSVCRVR